RLPPGEAPEGLDAVRVTAMFQEAEHTLFLSETDWRAAYDEISRHALTWCDRAPTSPTAEKLLVIAAKARLRLDDRAGCQRIIAQLRQRYPTCNWRAELQIYSPTEAP
ncbi:MAG TPA: hypothetical protein PKM88_16205, partial [bacterium]|nr:hypothetical protein [bacterium]